MLLANNIFIHVDVSNEFHNFDSMAYTNHLVLKEGCFIPQ